MNSKVSAFLWVLFLVSVTSALPAQASHSGESSRGEVSHGGGNGGGGGGGGGSHNMGGWGGSPARASSSGFFGSGGGANVNRGMNNNFNTGYPAATNTGGFRQNHPESFAQVQAAQMQAQQSALTNTGAAVVPAGTVPTGTVPAVTSVPVTTPVAAAATAPGVSAAYPYGYNGYPYGYNGYNAYNGYGYNGYNTYGLNGMAPNFNSLPVGTLMQLNNNLVAQQQYWMNQINSGMLTPQQLAYAQNMLVQLQAQQNSVGRTLNRDMNGNLQRSMAASALTAGLVSVVRGLGMNRTPAPQTVPETSVTGSVTGVNSQGQVIPTGN